MHQVDVGCAVQRIVFIEDADFDQDLLDALMALLGDMYTFVLFINRKITFFRFFFFSLTALLQALNDVSKLNMQIAVFANRTRDDQWRSGFIDQDGINFIDDGKVRRTLHFFFCGKSHVIAQIIKAVFIVCSVGDIRCVGLLLCHLIHAGDTDAGGHAQEVIQTPHPLSITCCQIIIDCDHVHTFAGQGIEVRRQCCHQCFTFTGLHLGNFAAVQNHAADQLHIKMAHAQYAATGLSYRSKSFG